LQQTSTNKLTATANAQSNTDSSANILQHVSDSGLNMGFLQETEVGPSSFSMAQVLMKQYGQMPATNLGYVPTRQTPQGMQSNSIYPTSSQKQSPHPYVIPSSSHPSSHGFATHAIPHYYSQPKSNVGLTGGYINNNINHNISINNNIINIHQQDNPNQPTPTVQTPTTPFQETPALPARETSKQKYHHYQQQALLQQQMLQQQLMFLARNPTNTKQPATQEVPQNMQFAFAGPELVVQKLGIVFPRESYFNENWIFPVGYSSFRHYPTPQPSNPNKTFYRCEILDGVYHPVFRITEETDHSNTVTSTNIDDCWRQIDDKIRRAYAEKQKPFTSLFQSGAEFFGLNEPDVINLIEQLENANKCRQYRFKNPAYAGSDNSQTMSHVPQKPGASSVTTPIIPSSNGAAPEVSESTEPSPNQLSAVQIENILEFVDKYLENVRSFDQCCNLLLHLLVSSLSQANYNKCYEFLYRTARLLSGGIVLTRGTSSVNPVLSGILLYNPTKVLRILQVAEKVTAFDEEMLRNVSRWRVVAEYALTIWDNQQKLQQFQYQLCNASAPVPPQQGQKTSAHNFGHFHPHQVTDTQSLMSAVSYVRPPGGATPATTPAAVPAQPRTAPVAPMGMVAQPAPKQLTPSMPSTPVAPPVSLPVAVTTPPLPSSNSSNNGNVANATIAREGQSRRSSSGAVKKRQTAHEILAIQQQNAERIIASAKYVISPKFIRPGETVSFSLDQQVCSGLFGSRSNDDSLNPQELEETEKPYHVHMQCFEYNQSQTTGTMLTIAVNGTILPPKQNFRDAYNINRYCIEGTNTIKVDYNGPPNTNLVVQVLVKKYRSSQELLSHIVSSVHTPSYDQMKNFIQESFNSRARSDSDVVQLSTVLSLRCPITRERIRVPGRSLMCPHIQSFCLLSFIKFSLKMPKRKWVCPICGLLLAFDTLIHDKFMNSILEQVQDKDVQEVELHKDGSWIVRHKEVEEELIDLTAPQLKPNDPPPVIPISGPPGYSMPREPVQPPNNAPSIPAASVSSTKLDNNNGQVVDEQVVSEGRQFQFPTSASSDNLVNTFELDSSLFTNNAQDIVDSFIDWQSYDNMMASAVTPNMNVTTPEITADPYSPNQH